MSSGLNKKEILKKITIIIPIIIAVVIFVMLVRSKKGPERRPAEERARAVRVITVQNTTVIPRAIGYGYAEPGQVWLIVPEVSGKIIEVSESFKKGNFAKKGGLIIRIDPSEYRLAVAQTEANIENIKAQISELIRKEENYKISLKIQEETLRLKKNDVDRNKKALDANSISHSRYEQAEMEYQNQYAKVQDIKNSLELIPSTRKALEANIDLNKARLAEAKLNLERTAVVVPFDCRITSTKAEIGQYVQRGQTIGEADGIETAEITAQIPMYKMRSLVQGTGMIGSEELSMDKIRDHFGLKITVRLRSGDFETEWDARFARADATIDSKTGTLGVIVVIDNPYKKIIIGERPPLVRNTYCEVEISGKPVSDVIVIPKSALHENYVYMVDAQNRLKRKTVEVNFSQTNFYVIKSGIEQGEKIIVSDLIPAIEGMLLDPVEDNELNEQLIAEAAGNSEVK